MRALVKYIAPKEPAGDSQDEKKNRSLSGDILHKKAGFLC